MDKIQELYHRKSFQQKRSYHQWHYGENNQSRLAQTATFELQSFGPSIIRIKSLATNYYLVMKKNGLFTGDKRAGTLQSLFRETHQYNAFNSYASVKYFHKYHYDMYIGIKHNGKMKRAMKTHRVQSATQFVVIKV
ncbi:fibroblast growth factor 1-like [Paramuricea clavata]|uniref:Fibroblast growth factor 1-like n=1 Tax=Paramuricea clavata TaxID=317549 RepID=A0A7D9HR83_PARCT|nr:fibroblast growth factor 1-like [Paramuricea clavata]